MAQAHDVTSNLACNPDGSVVFATMSGIVKLDSEGKPMEAYHLSDGLGSITAVASSADGQIAFVKGPALWQLIDGLPLRLSENGVEVVGIPAYSPDSTKLAFVSYQPSEQTWNIEIIENGAHFSVPVAASELPAWSPDSQSLAFVAGHDVYIMGPDGIPIIISGDGQISPRDITWSPDGKTVAYLASRSSRDPSPEDRFSIETLYVVDTSSGQLLVQTSLRSASGLAWSPDGSWVIVPQNTLEGAVVDFVPVEPELQDSLSMDGGSVSSENEVDLGPKGNLEIVTGVELEAIVGDKIEEPIR